MEVIGLLLPVVQVFDLLSMADPALASQPRDRVNFGMDRGEQQAMVCCKPARDLVELPDGYWSDALLR